MIEARVMRGSCLLTALLPIVLSTACRTHEPEEQAPESLRIKLDVDQYRAAIHTWSDAALRIDRELIQAEARQDPKAIRMIRYRRAFAAIVLERLRRGEYEIVIVDPEHPPAPTKDLLSTYAHVIHDETGSWAALIQVRREDEPALFELFEATKYDFIEPSGEEGKAPSTDGR